MKDIMKEKVVRQYILFSTLFTVSGSITFATYVTFLQANGLTLLQVNLVNTVFFVTLFASEIPTGAFADIFGRKRSFVLACTFWGIGHLIYGLTHTFWTFLVAEMISALGFTFMSGAFKAWLVDSLIHRGYQGSNLKVFSRTQFYSQVFGAVSGIIGSHLAAHSLQLPWFAGALIAGILALMAQITMKEEYFVPKEFSFKKGFWMMKDTAVSSIRYGINDKTVRFILVVNFVQIFAVQVINMFWQPFFGNQGVSKVNFGYIMAGGALSVAVGGCIASSLASQDKEKKIIMTSQISVGIFIILTAVASGLPLILILFLLHEVGRGFWGPMKDRYLHERIPSSERATIDSFCSISPDIGGAIGLVISGVIAEYGGIPLSWIFSGFVLIVGALLVARNGKEKAP